MRILFNCLVNREGGAIQNAANFIMLAMADTANSFVFITSQPVYDLLGQWQAVDSRVHVLKHPLSSRSVRKKALDYERSFKPDVVYTMAGPTYLRFKSYHLLGISDGYITHADFSSFFYGRSLFAGVKHLCRTILKGVVARSEGDAFIFQTETARLGFCRRFNLNEQDSCTVPNAVGKSFSEVKASSIFRIGARVNELTVLCPSADYSHKDLFIIERIARFVSGNSGTTNRMILNFIVTVKEGCEFSKKIGLINSLDSSVRVSNFGPYSYADAASLYEACDVVFMPSVLETFSTSYLEALAAGKFLVVADKSFSREICSDAAIYFEPKNAMSAYDAFSGLVELSRCPDVKKYSLVLNKYGNYEKRYGAIIRYVHHFFNLSK